MQLYVILASVRQWLIVVALIFNQNPFFEMARKEVCGSFGLDISSEFLWEPLSTRLQMKVSKVPHTGWVGVVHCSA